MGAKKRITRRQILQQLAIGFGANVIGFRIVEATIAWPKSYESELHQALPKLNLQLESAVNVGRAYLELFGDERSAGALMKRILGSLPAGSSEIDARALRRRILADFEHDETVNLHGWVLSQTECRLCALCAV